MLDMSAANLSTTPDGGLMSEPFQGHLRNSPPPCASVYITPSPIQWVGQRSDRSHVCSHPLGGRGDGSGAVLIPGLLLVRYYVEL